MIQAQRRPEQPPIFVVSQSGKPLAPTRRPGRVRHLLTDGRAQIICRDPFTIQLTYESPEVVPVVITVGIDPGAKDTPIAVEEHMPDSDTSSILYVKEILLRTDITAQLKRRSSARSERRNRKTRYRKPRFHNRPKAVCSICGVNHTPKVWKRVKRKQGGKSLKKVANGRAAVCRRCQHERPGERGKHDADRLINPTLRNKVDTIVKEVQRLAQVLPITKIRVELTAFDTQKMARPEIQGAEYQHGTLFGYEIKEYLLQKFGHRCAYCQGKSHDPILEVEHTIPQSRGGTNRVANLAIACETCNRKKGSRTAEEFGFPTIHKAAARHQVFRYSALTQSYKWGLWRTLQTFGIPLEATFGYRTKYDRLQKKLPKAQIVDAMVIAAGDRNFELPATYLVERRLKVRKPYHRFSNEHKPGRTCVKTPAARTVHGFRLYDKVSFVGSDGAIVYGYITGLRERGGFEVSYLEGDRIADKNWKRLTPEKRTPGNRLMERRSIIGAIVRTLQSPNIL